MNDQKPKSKANSAWTAAHDAAVEHLAAADKRVRESDTSVTRGELGDAVDAARAAGVGWTKIGDTLGIASGNAYQRYRKRSAPCDSL